MQPNPTNDTDRAANGDTTTQADRRILAVVLAAGGGTRYRGATHKLNAPLGDLTIGLHAIGQAIDADIGPVVVVTGAVPLVDLPPDVIELSNPAWPAGQATSLAVAVDFARRQRAEAIVVGLADQPFVTADAWRRVGLATADIAFATYDGRRGHPVRFGADVWDRLPTTGDIGAREVIRVYEGSIDAIPCSGSAVDIDTVEDLETWQNNSSTSSPSTDRSTRRGH